MQYAAWSTHLFDSYSLHSNALLVSVVRSIVIGLHISECASLHTLPSCPTAAEVVEAAGLGFEATGDGVSPARRGRKKGLAAYGEGPARTVIQASLEVDQREREMVGGRGRKGCALVCGQSVTHVRMCAHDRTCGPVCVCDCVFVTVCL